MLSRTRNWAWQRGQWDLPLMVSPRGIRQATTLRKLPTEEPTQKHHRKITTSIARGTINSDGLTRGLARACRWGSPKTYAPIAAAVPATAINSGYRMDRRRRDKLNSNKRTGGKDRTRNLSEDVSRHAICLTPPTLPRLDFPSHRARCPAERHSPPIPPRPGLAARRRGRR